MKNLNLFNSTTAYTANVLYGPAVSYNTQTDKVRWNNGSTISFTTRSTSSAATLKINNSIYYEQITRGDTVTYPGKITSLQNFISNEVFLTIDVSDVDTSFTTNMFEAFCYPLYLTSITGLENWDTSNVTNMYAMFGTCFSLSTLNISNFQTSGVTNMEGMFDGDSALTSVNMANFNMSNVTSHSNMFRNCTALTALTITNVPTATRTLLQTQLQTDIAGSSWTISGNNLIREH
jgi:surface protein